jgi:hypothetical protein
MDHQVGVQPLADLLTDVVERPVAGPRDEVSLLDDLQLSFTTMLEMVMGTFTYLVEPALRTQVST